MPEKLTESEISEFWRTWFMEGPPPNETRLKNVLRRLPTDPRCTYCHAPFKGAGAWVVKATLGKVPSPHNPGYCNVCDGFAQEYGGGAEVDMAMLFADVRGSTKLSETLSPREFSRLIERFYAVATEAIVDAPGFIDRLGGDEVIAFFGRGLAGDDYVKVAIQTGVKILEATGHQHKNDPWIPIGVGVHAGQAFFGSVVGQGGLFTITALGEEVNTAARLASEAAAGELLASHAAMREAGLQIVDYPQRELSLKGISAAVPVSVLKVGAGEKITV
jgi:adenylate cyclase